MKQIELTKGKFCIVDDDDFEKFGHKAWFCSSCGYAVRTVDVLLNDGRKRKSREILHRLILNVPKGKQTDHINGNKLDNRKTNLRIVTKDQNNLNRGPRLRSTSRYKGVCWDNQKKKWMAKIGTSGKTIFLGRFSSQEDAALAYNKAALDIQGDFARINDISLG